MHSAKVDTKIICKTHKSPYSLLSRATFHDFGPFGKLTAQNAGRSKKWEVFQFSHCWLFIENLL